jgi:putative ABC transport system permease protein
MWTLARKLLLHDKVKFFVASAGVSVSVLLVLLQIGLYLGFMQNASNLIDHSDADIWVTGEGNENFDFAAPMSEENYFRVASTPGVGHAERMVLAFGQWRLANGGTQGVEVVGLERNARLLQPWNVVAGDARRTREAHGIVVDQSEFPKLGASGLGDHNEIFGVRSEIVGVTKGIRSFTTSPFVFTNLETAHAYVNFAPDRISYVLVDAAPGANQGELLGRLERLPNLMAFTTPAFSARTRGYWSSRTGVGAGFFTTAVMGVLVGFVVVGQILYTGTLQHLREYGTLKAMGASNASVVGVVLLQALLSAVIGYVVGGSLSFLAREAVAKANLTLVLSNQLLVATAILTALMCGFASLLSILKVVRLDPASVFKG